jgi:hypothetical protein
MSFNKILVSKFWPVTRQVFVIFYAFLILPLIAWGVDDLTGFFFNQIRMTFAFIVVLQAFIGAWLVFITPPQPKHEQPVDLAHWQIDMYHVVFILAAYSDRRNVIAWAENLPLQWLGLGIYLAGVALSVWANLHGLITCSDILNTHRLILQLYLKGPINMSAIPGSFPSLFTAWDLHSHSAPGSGWFYWFP